MIAGPVRRFAPWLSRAGAPVFLSVPLLCLLLALVTSPRALAAQIPDSLRVDTLRVDSLQVDSLPGDSLQFDTLQFDSLAADTLPFDSLHIDNVPTSRRRSPAGFHTGTWEWDRDDLQWAPAFTLGDLLATVPGILTFRAGEYGMPNAVGAFGSAAGRVRVVSDGIERVPYEGGALDLTQISLAGVEHVRVRRSAGGILVELESFRFDDARAYSQIDVGTGDLQTNMFRGTFGLPKVAGGSAVASLERIDTRGPGGKEPGALSEVWVRYGVTKGDRGGIEFDLRKRTQDRGELFTPTTLSRTEWSGRARVRITDGVLLGAHYGHTGLQAVNALTSDTARSTDVRELGTSLWVDRGPVWGVGTFRSFSGEGLPGSVLEATGGLDDERVGGFAASLRRESWDGVSLGRSSLRAWTSPRFGAFLFAELDRGETGIPFLPRLDPILVLADSVYEPYAGGLRIDDRSTRRLGAGFAWRGLRLEGARLTVDADSVFPLGLPVDRGPAAFPGGRREGYEASANIPLIVLDGLTFQGSLVRWDLPGPPAPDSGAVEVEALAPDAWPYLPRLSYDARLRFRNAFLPTGNFELLVDLGVREREAMRVFHVVDTLRPAVVEEESGEEPMFPATDIVRFNQNWYARLEMRIVSLKIFVEWENLSVRRDRADFPERILAATRAVYGVRWTLLN